MFLRAFLVLFGFGLVACSPSADKLRTLVEENPDVVFVAIEKDPAGFMEVVRKASSEAQKKAFEKRQAEEKQRREDEFKNPKNPEIAAGRAVFGEKDAPITIVEYSDFQCFYCSKAHSTMEALQKKYPSKVRLVYKHLPFQQPWGRAAAEYFEAVAMQSTAKAKKFHDYVFANQSKLRSKGKDFLTAAVKHAGANVARVVKDAKGDKVRERIEADMAEGKKFGFNGTPGFLVNGVTLKGAQPLSEFVSVIDRLLGGDKAPASDTSAEAAGQDEAAG